MAEKITMNAQLREETGKNKMRRLRSSGLLPGIIFGRSGETTPVSFTDKELEKIIHSESGFNTIFTLDIEGETQKPLVMIKEYQLDPVTHNFLHVSFYRVHADRLVEVNVAITTRGVAPGVKDEGGTLDFVMREVKVECLPGDIPESFVVDISKMIIGEHVRVEDLDIPEKVKVLEEPEAVVLHLAPPRKVEEVVEAEEAEEAAEALAEAAEEAPADAEERSAEE
ncbi:MAG TPA: 50S ribosomal protein L25 [Acidobacteriota bacterium]|nr:50S ribosomal protein L25 [Acidobacteriota bacterium]